MFQACNSFQCGFDAGDCGLTDYYKMYKITAKLNNGSTYQVPDGRHAAYVELSEVGLLFASFVS